MERNRKKKLVGVIITVVIILVSILISTATATYFSQQKNQKEIALGKVQKISEFKGETKEVKNLYIKGLLTEEETSQEFREILLKAEEISSGFTYHVKFEIEQISENVGPDPEETANIIINELNELIYELTSEAS